MAVKNIFKLEIDPSRVFGLDILRAAAILFVVLAHGGSLLPQPVRIISDYFVFDGVSIFFVLSGFLIGGILLKIIEHKIDTDTLFGFWKRRWFRTLPTYFLVLLFLVLYNLVFIEEFKIFPVLSYFIFSQNIISPHPAFFPEAWSLSIEEWFYLIVPLLIFLLIRICRFSNQVTILTVAFTIIGMVTILRYLLFGLVSDHTETSWDLIFRKQVFTRLDSLMFGVLGAYLHYYYNRQWLMHKHFLFVAGIGIFLGVKFVFPEFIPFSGVYHFVFSFTTISIATLLLLPFLSSLQRGSGLIFKAITYVSLTSYSMYLLNFSVVKNVILRNIPWADIVESKYLYYISRYSLYWFLVIILSILLYKYFELPMTRLRDANRIRKAVEEKE